MPTTTKANDFAAGAQRVAALLSAAVQLRANSANAGTNARRVFHDLAAEASRVAEQEAAELLSKEDSR